MGGGHDMNGGHGGRVKGFVSNLVGGGKGHGQCYGGQGQEHGYGGQAQHHGYGGHGQQHGYGGHGQHGCPPPAAGACPPYGYAPAAYPAQPAPHHGTQLSTHHARSGHMGMGSYQTGHGGGHGHGHGGGKFGGGKHGRKWK